MKSKMRTLTVKDELFEDLSRVAKDLKLAKPAALRILINDYDHRMR